jgi:hypothetical protein
VLCVRLKCSNTRSRPRQLCAYSPTGRGSSVSVAPPLVTGTIGYTLPVEKATIRPPRYLRHTSAGNTAFIAHVRACCPVVPNFMPAM